MVVKFLKKVGLLYNIKRRKLHEWVSPISDELTLLHVIHLLTLKTYFLFIMKYGTSYLSQRRLRHFRKTTLDKINRVLRTSLTEYLW